MIPLAHREFDDSHCGLRHTLGEMTTGCGKCSALHFLEESVASKFVCQSIVYIVLRVRYSDVAPIGTPTRAAQATPYR